MTHVYMRFCTGGARAGAVSEELAAEAFRRDGSNPGSWATENAAWLDGAYSIDAPGTCLAGSMLNAGPVIDGEIGSRGFPFPSFYERF